MAKAHGQTRVRIVGYDAGSPEIFNPGATACRGAKGRGMSPFFVSALLDLDAPMEQQLSPVVIERLLKCGAELGAIKALTEAGKLKPYLKKAEAFRLYGRKQVEHWINDGLITPRKDGDHSAAWRICRLEIASIAVACELNTFL